MKANLTTPAGRLVAGSLYRGNDKDAEGRPLVYKNGADAGKPRKDYFFALAIPKGPEVAHGAFGWMATAWGAEIRKVAEAFMAHATQLPTFAWKVKDGDSQVPNKKGKKPCDNEGWPGHWVLMMSNSFAPRCYTLIGAPSPVELVQADAINLGDYVQVNFDVEDNGAQSQPGVYLNHRMVCLLGYGQRIVVGPDVGAAGFGGVALPAGASVTPPAGFTPPPTAGAPVVPGVPAVPGAAPSLPAPLPPSMPPALPAAPGMAAAPPAVPIQPNPAFLVPPGMPVVPVPPAAVPAQRVLTPKAAGHTYEQLIGAGWTDDTLRAQGLML